jgi:hypothetical protein
MNFLKSNVMSSSIVPVLVRARILAQSEPADRHASRISRAPPLAGARAKRGKSSCLVDDVGSAGEALPDVEIIPSVPPRSVDRAKSFEPDLKRAYALGLSRRDEAVAAMREQHFNA